jgi:Transmembrane secretion effector
MAGPGGSVISGANPDPDGDALVPVPDGVNEVHSTARQLDEHRPPVVTAIGMTSDGPRRAAPLAPPVHFIDVLRSRVFRALYLAETQSVLGDQLARVALSVLVFEQTHSTSETALTYALTFLPAILGGALLSGLGDRFPRRSVMVFCDLVRAGLLAAMAATDLPIGVLYVLLIAVVFVGPAFTGAEISLVAAVLDGEPYRVGMGLRMITNQVAQVAGFAIGGALVAMLSPQSALRVDACSFVLSALVIAYGTRGVRAAGRQTHATPTDAHIGIRAVLAVFRSDPRIRALVGLAWLAGFFVVPEGLAAPYAASIGGDTATIGLLMTAIPAGTVFGAYLLIRRVRPAARSRAVRVMAVLAGLPLLGCAATPGIAISVSLWFACGLFTAYLLDVLTSIVQLTPAEVRGRMVGVVGAGLIGVQGVGLIVFGVLADHAGAGPAIAIAGGIGALCGAFLAVRFRQHGMAPAEAGR